MHSKAQDIFKNGINAHAFYMHRGVNEPQVINEDKFSMPASEPVPSKQVRNVSSYIFPLTGSLTENVITT